MEEGAQADGVAEVMNWRQHPSLGRRTLYAGELKGEPAKLTVGVGGGGLHERELPPEKRAEVEAVDMAARQFGQEYLNQQ